MADFVDDDTDTACHPQCLVIYLQRLPANPRVIKPLQSVDEYGGTWHRAYQGLSDRWGPTKLMEEPLSRWEAPDVNTIQVVPNFAEKWDQNSDATEFTFHLRQGLKWSDGQPVTTDDARFWWEDVQQNKDLVTAPSFVVSQQVKGKTVLASVDFPDQYTIHVKYASPFPLLPIFMAKLGGAGPTQPAFIVPSHYLKQFMPKYGDQAKIDALVKQKGLATWTDLWGKAGDMQGPIAFWMLNPGPAGGHRLEDRLAAAGRPDDHGAQPLLLDGRYRRQPVALYRPDQPQPVHEPAGAEPLDRQRQDRPADALYDRRRLHVLQAERGQGRLPHAQLEGRPRPAPTTSA